VLAAAILTSLAPPSKALAEVGKAAARVGPGAVQKTVQANGYTLAVTVAPNQAAVPNDFRLRLTRGGQVVRGADVTLSFAMLDMEMGEQAYQLRETEPGTYSHSAPALVMVGHWGLDFTITPRGGREFDVLVVDKAAG
jgi:copper transport protein